MTQPFFGQGFPVAPQVAQPPAAPAAQPAFMPQPAPVAAPVPSGSIFDNIPLNKSGRRAQPSIGQHLIEVETLTSKASAIAGQGTFYILEFKTLESTVPSEIGQQRSIVKKAFANFNYGEKTVLAIVCAVLGYEVGAPEIQALLAAPKGPDGKGPMAATTEAILNTGVYGAALGIPDRPIAGAKIVLSVTANRQGKVDRSGQPFHEYTFHPYRQQA